MYKSTNYRDNDQSHDQQASAKIKISDHLIFFWENNNFVCDNYLNHNQKVIDPKVIPILEWFNDWTVLEKIENLCTKHDYDLEKVVQWIIDLIHSNILITDQNEFEEGNLQKWKDWGKATQYFHFYSRGMEKDEFIPVVKDFDRLNKKTKLEKTPDIYKNYKNTIYISLPIPKLDLEKNFVDVLLNRQTIRTYDPALSISKDQLSTALFLVWGATSCWMDQGIGKALLKTSPSGGSRHPIEVYCCVLNVDGIDPGIYHYSVLNHELELIKKDISREKVIEFCGGQPHTGLPAVVFFYTAVIERETWKYSVPKAYRALFMDLGHLSQTLYLVASWMNLGCFFTAALRDELVEKELGLDWTEEVSIGVSGIGALSNEVYREKNGGRFVRKDILR